MTEWRAETHLSGNSRGTSPGFETACLQHVSLTFGSFIDENNADTWRSRWDGNGGGNETSPLKSLITNSSPTKWSESSPQMHSQQCTRVLPHSVHTGPAALGKIDEEACCMRASVATKYPEADGRSGLSCGLAGPARASRCAAAA